MDKRASLRREFDDKRANQESAIKSDKMHSEKLARLSSVEKTIANSFEVLLNYIDKNISKVELTNQLDSIKTPDTKKVVDELKILAKTVESTKTDQKPVIEALNALKREITLLPAKIPQPKDQKDTIKVSNLSEVKLDTSSLEKAIKALDLKVDAPIVNIESDSYKNELKDILKAIRSIVIPEVKIPEQIPTDTSKIEKKLDESNKHLKIIAEKKFGGSGGGNGSPYTDANGIVKNVILTLDGKIPVEANQTDGSQKTQIVDNNGYNHVFENYGLYAVDSDDATYFYVMYQNQTGAWRIIRITLIGGITVYAKGTSGASTNWTGRAGLTYADYATTFN